LPPWGGEYWGLEKNKKKIRIHKFIVRPVISTSVILGALFRSANYQRRQTELVIIISAHLVTPTRGEALALPTDRIKPPTEQDLFLYGRTAAGTRTPKKGAAGEVAQQDFTGSYGYVLD